MLAGFARLFEDVDILLGERRIGMVQIVFVDELREAQRTGHPRRPSADDHNIGLHLRAVDTFKRFAKVDHFISGKISASASQQAPQPDSLL